MMYGIIGAFSVGLDFLIYSILVIVGVNLLLANVVGVNIGIVTSFCLNRKHNFRVTDHTRRRFMTFYIVGLIGLAISTGMLLVMVDLVGCDEYLAKIVTIVAVALIQFFLNKTITFKVKSTD